MRINVNDLVVESGGKLHADEKGWHAGNSIDHLDGYGPGGGEVGAGGNYGGGKNVYGSMTLPVDMGSGGGALLRQVYPEGPFIMVGGDGGGIIILNVKNTLIVDGTISVDGGNGQGSSSGDPTQPGVGSGGGSGGSIFIITDGFAGNGIISSRGGNGWTDPTYPEFGSGGGSGGRIAIYYNTSSFFGDVNTEGGSGAVDSPKGTVVMERLSPEASLTFAELNDVSNTESIFSEIVTEHQVSLNDVIVTGDFYGELNSTSFEFVTIETGPFSDKGFFKCKWSAILEGASCKGVWKGVCYPDPDTSWIRLEGQFSGDLIGIAGGYFYKSSGSADYDSFHGRCDVTHVYNVNDTNKIEMEGEVSWGSTTDYPSTLITVQQLHYDGNVTGFNYGPLSLVMTDVHVSDDIPYQNEGFSICSYQSDAGSGQGFMYRKSLDYRSNILQFDGVFSDPMIGLASACLDYDDPLKNMYFTVMHKDVGADLMSHLKLNAYSSWRVSPGQEISYAIDAFNNGINTLENINLLAAVPWEVTYKRNTGGGTYIAGSRKVKWIFDLPAKSHKRVSITGDILFGLEDDDQFWMTAYVPRDIEIKVDPSLSIMTDTLSLTADQLTAKTLLLKNGQEESCSIEFTMNISDATQEIEPETFINETPEGIEVGCRFTIYIDNPNTLNKASTNGLPNRILKKIVILMQDETFNAFYSKISPLLVVPTMIDIGIDRYYHLKTIDYFYENDWILTELARDDFFKLELGYTLVKILWVAFLQTPAELLKLTPFGSLLVSMTAEKLNIMDFLERQYQREFAYELRVFVVNQYLFSKAKYYKQVYDHETKLWRREIPNGLVFTPPQLITVAHDPNEKHCSLETVNPGQTIDYTIEYENEGEGIAFGVYIGDELDEDIEDAGLIINDGGIYDPSTRSITWFIGQVDPHQQGQVTFSAPMRSDASPGTDVINWAVVHFPSVPEIIPTNPVVSIYPANRPPTVTIDDTYTVNEGDTVWVSATGVDPDGGPITYAWDLDNDGSFETQGQSVPFSAAGLDGPGSFYINVKVTDDGGMTGTSQASVQIQNVAPVIGTITAPVDPVRVGEVITASAVFTDPGIPDTFTATWHWGDDSTSQGTITKTDNVYSVMGTHTYSKPGVYTISLTVSDDDDSTDQAIYYYAVAFDPDAGFVTGGGWIDSPEGAYTPDSTLYGKANFGFVSKYKKGKSVPEGNTQFHFKVAKFKFSSTDYQWLVIAGPHAKFKGSGTINDSGDYGFMLTATDGQVTGGGDVDKFRIKIWEKDENETVIYDNQMGDADDAEATDAIEGGSVVIHSTAMEKGDGIVEDPQADEDGNVTLPDKYMLFQNYPNPFNPETEIRFALPEASDVIIRIFNISGQQICTLIDDQYEAGYHSVVWNGKDRYGNLVSSGIYIYQIQAGDFVKVRKMSLLR